MIEHGLVQQSKLLVQLGLEESEKPAGEKDHGSYTSLVYTEEQQERLGVDENGKKVAHADNSSANACNEGADVNADDRTRSSATKQTLGPAWTRGEIEKPAGEKDHGSYTSLVYTEEQQERLGVDENGKKVAHADNSNVSAGNEG